MTARDDAIALIEDLLKLGRIRDFEARALRDGLNEILPMPGATFVPTPTAQLAELRRAKGISQKVVAEACGVTVQAVSQWENGKSVPSPRNYTILNDLLGVGRVS